MNYAKMDAEQFTPREVENELAEYGIPMDRFVELEGVRDSYPRDIVLDWMGAN